MKYLRQSVKKLYVHVHIFYLYSPASMVHNIYDGDLVNEKPFSEIFSEFLQWISSIVTTAEKHTGIIYTPDINYCFYFILHLLPHNICFYVVLVAHNGFNFDFPCLLSEISILAY